MNDKIGDYQMNGTFNPQNGRMVLNKKYIIGTGDKWENLGHNVRIRLQWNKDQKQFDGTFYVKTNRYEGTGLWSIKLEQSTQSI